MDDFVVRSGPRLAAAAVLLGALAAATFLAGACSGAGPAPGAVSPDAGEAVQGSPDAGPIAAAPDAGAPDAGPQFGTPGPWPVANQAYSSGDGIQESPVVGMTTDEAQNRWIATHTALYLAKPGEKTLRRFTSADGLHLMDNPASIKEDSCGSTAVVTGAALPPGILTIAGGAAGEVFVGYQGADEMVGDCTDPAWARHSGKIDRVRLQPDGTLEVKRFDLASAGYGLNFWHNRSVYRLVYDHGVVFGQATHPHTLYVGTNHGVDLLLPDKYRDPNPGEWSGFPILEWMGDHLHPRVCIEPGGAPCPFGEGNERYGDWRGLAIAADGDLWVAGRWTAGKIRWDPLGPLHWEHDRSGAEAFSEAFGDPAATNPPVFPVAQEGEIVSLTAVAVAPDDTAWFGNKNVYGSPGERDRGIASFKAGKGFTYYSPFDVGMSETAVQDIVALPDGRLVFAGPSTGLVFYDPATKRHVALRAGQGIPDDRVLQLEVDGMVSPPALHVATAGGAAVIRVFPQ
jgi:hypothetical protein